MEPTPTLPFAVNLGPAPKIGTPDLTRFDLTPFPKNEAQRACYNYLHALMLATPDRPPCKKDDLEKACRKKFKVTVESFETAWREAIKATGSRWNRRGRRRR
jgi:hypothetical protein